MSESKINRMDNGLNSSIIPNVVTWSRIIAIPLIVLLWLSPLDEHRYFITFVFAYAGLTDLVDGYLARKYHSVTSFGTMLDPIADKLLFAVVSVMLIYSDVVGGFDIIAVLLIISREIFISGMREHAAKQGISIKVTNIAKYKTVIQLIALGTLCPIIPDQFMGELINTTGVFLLWSACLLTIWTGWEYSRGYSKSTN